MAINGVSDNTKMIEHIEGQAKVEFIDGLPCVIVNDKIIGAVIEHERGSSICTTINMGPYEIVDIFTYDFDFSDEEQSKLGDIKIPFSMKYALY